jgi:hypothetical protein
MYRPKMVTMTEFESDRRFALGPDIVPYDEHSWFFCLCSLCPVGTFQSFVFENACRSFFVETPQESGSFLTFVTMHFTQLAFLIFFHLILAFIQAGALPLRVRQNPTTVQTIHTTQTYVVSCHLSFVYTVISFQNCWPND